MIDNPEEKIRRWWRTSIIDMSPGKISFRGKPIEEIIGNFSFPEMIWYMLLGSRPTPNQSKLFNAALVAGVDHGPQAPSIAVARMAITSGVALNNAMGSAVNILGDVHGGAGEQCAELLYAISQLQEQNITIKKAVKTSLEKWRERHGKIISGFGHRFHKPVDPRAPRLLSLVESIGTIESKGAKEDKENIEIDRKFVVIGREVEKTLTEEKGKSIPMNIDGATAVVFCALGFPPPLVRGLFCLSRSVGILAHAWEQMNQGGRNKGPMPPEFLPWYEGKNNSNKR